MNIVHPVADEWGEDYAVFAASAEHVILSEPLAAFLDYAVTERLRPVLVSSIDSRLSSFVSLAMRRAGGLWAVQGSDGATYDGLSGYRIDSLRDLWERPGQGTERLQSFRSMAPDPRAVLMFDVFAHQRAAADTSVGQLSTTLVTALGGAPLDLWGPFEPLVDRWDTRTLTDVARRSMPVSDVMHARSRDGSYADLFVGRTRRGILEQVKGGVPVGSYPQAVGGVVETASSALATIAEEFQPTIGFVSLAEVDGVTHVEATAKRPEVPLAVVIGPRGVHDLEVDTDALAERHDVTVLGRKRTPSLLVRFSDPDQGLWAQLVAFAHDLGVDRLAAAAGLGKD